MNMPNNPPHNTLRHHVTGAIERGEKEAITEHRATGSEWPGWVVTRDNKPLALFRNHNDAFAWLLNHQGQSVAWACEHEGYAIEHVEPWPAAVARDHRNTAHNVMYRDSYHNTGGCRRDGRLGRENCGPCVLHGYEPPGGYEDGYKVKRDGPNYAGWHRIYVETCTPIPENWRNAFDAVFDATFDNPAYAYALARSIKTWGVTFR